jgi:hypothetical protein|tara:strand:- start:1213 stop:1491 length:279 start_codon:yes stop_codon:yes gene_type:complete
VKSFLYRTSAEISHTVSSERSRHKRAHRPPRTPSARRGHGDPEFLSEYEIERAKIIAQGGDRRESGGGKGTSVQGVQAETAEGLAIYERGGA